jgi:predicted lipid carrier protein YhbT
LPKSGQVVKWSIEFLIVDAAQETVKVAAMLHDTLLIVVRRNDLDTAFDGNFP